MSYSRSRTQSSNGCLVIIIQTISASLILAAFVYWYAHLWHHWTAQKIHLFPHSLVLGFVWWILLPKNNHYVGFSPMKALTAILFAATLIAQTLVWLDLLPKPIF